MSVWRHYTRRELLGTLIHISMVVGTIGIALKFLTFQIVLNERLYSGDVLNSVWYPYFPNVVDVAFLILSILYVSHLAIKNSLHSTNMEKEK
jgi:hypothetical protein